MHLDHRVIQCHSTVECTPSLSFDSIVQQGVHKVGQALGGIVGSHDIIVYIDNQIQAAFETKVKTIYKCVVKAHPNFGIQSSQNSLDNSLQ